MSILFYDVCNPKPYDTNVLAKEGLGGTEATVVRVSNALTKAGLCVTVEQNREDCFPASPDDAFYCPLECQSQAAKHVIALRSPKVLRRLSERFSAAKLYLWMHDLPVAELYLPFFDDLVALNVTVITVSEWHKTQTVEMFKSAGYTGQFPIIKIHNPIADDLVPDGTVYDKNKLVFFSSPHKGLDLALHIFKNLRTFNPDFKLYIGNPGYIADPDMDGLEGVIPLGSLAQGDMLSHVRSSLCVFYPNVVFPETFGLVMAEANAVGVPVVTHELGAAREVLDQPHYEIVNCRDPRAVIERVMLYYKGERPTVRGKAAFRLSTICQTWKRMLR